MRLPALVYRKMVHKTQIPRLKLEQSVALTHV